jgi:DMSO reductase anchor subunit
VPARALLVATLVALVMATVGLLSSTLHLGKPLRAWRAFSQWRTSWLSREGVAAVLTYVPALVFAAALLPAMIAGHAQGAPIGFNATGKLLACVLMALSLTTVHCTAMIYASLKPIPAWAHRLVAPWLPAVRAADRRPAAGGDRDTRWRVARQRPGDAGWCCWRSRCGC